MNQSIQTEFKNIYKAHQYRLQPGMTSRSTRRTDRLLHTDGSSDTHIKLQPYYTQSNHKPYDTANHSTNPDAIHISFDHNYIRRQPLNSHLYRSNQQDRYLY